jgi:succinylarginine dihydrolase
VADAEVSVADAVGTYLFNSQLVCLPEGGMAIVLPREAEGHAGIARLLARMQADPACPLERAVFLDVRESMRNGGGPACLRLRVPLRDADIPAIAPGCLWSPERHAALCDWVRRRYREELAPADLADPRLLDESRAALDELTRMLGLGAIYEFQR